MPANALRADDARPAPMRPGFLGINVAEIPEALAAHIDVPAGQGVMVRLVAPGSAADAAGLQLHDVILKINDRPVASHEDVDGIVANHQEGDALRIDVLRKGKPREIEVVLAAKPNGIAGQPEFGMPWNAPMPGLDDGFFNGIPDDQIGRIRGMIERNLRALRDPDGLMDDDIFRDAFQGMREQMNQLLEDPQRFAPLGEQQGGIGNIQMNAGATVRMMDNQGSVEFKMIDGSKEITVRDLDNEIIWLGPWDTEQDKAAAPDDVRERIQRLNIDQFQDGNRLEMRLFRDR